jgi:hypothetical protein
MTPMICVKRDYDGYFQWLLETYIKWKKGQGLPFKHKRIILTAGPFRANGMICWDDKDDPSTLHVDFYSAFRIGFGGLSDADMKSFAEQWL